MNKLIFEINNGDKQVWEQCENDGNVHLYRLEQDWEKSSEIVISPGDMVMLANLYREIKRIGIRDVFVNPYGNAVLSSGDSVTSALEKQIPKKPQKSKEQRIRFTDSYICPFCGGNFTGTGIADFCYHCGQALDWSDTE